MRGPLRERWCRSARAWRGLAAGRLAILGSLDLSGMPGAACARWYDPVAGTVVHRWTVRRPARGEDFETPGPNVSGWNDWALVVEGTGPCVG